VDECKCLHSSTVRLIVSTFCGIRWLYLVFQLQEAAQVDIKSERGSDPASDAERALLVHHAVHPPELHAEHEGR